MKLYVLAGACSMVPHTALEWIGEQYAFEVVGRDQLKSPEYLALNPQGAVPLLVDGDFVLAQNVAILQYLNTKHPDANLFGVKKTIESVARAWHWLVFCNADLHKAFAPIFHTGQFVSDDDAHADVVGQAKKKIASLFEYPNDTLSDNDYLTGEKTIADIYLYVMLRWAKALDIDLTHLTYLAEFFGRVEKDAGVQAVIEKEELKQMT